MDDTDSLSRIISSKVDPSSYGSKFSRPVGSADGGSTDRTRGDQTAMQESTLAGLRAMLKDIPGAKAPVRSLRPHPVASQIRETRPSPKAESSLLESGDILENTAFKFMVTIQELTEDGGFLGRGAGVGRIRVRGSEMGLYRRVGKRI